MVAGEDAIPALDQLRRSRVCHRDADYEFNVRRLPRPAPPSHPEPTSVMATALGQRCRGGPD
jgi:hypothetical protein